MLCRFPALLTACVWRTRAELPTVQHMYFCVGHTPCTSPVQDVPKLPTQPHNHTLACCRPPGWRIVTMFLSASNFTPAPTGSSTLERFLKPKQQQQQQQQQQQLEGSSDHQGRPLLESAAQQPDSGGGGGELEAAQQPQPAHQRLAAAGHGGMDLPPRKRRRPNEHQARLQAYMPAAVDHHDAASSGQRNTPPAGSTAVGGPQQLLGEQQQVSWASALDAASLPPSVGAALGATATGTASLAAVPSAEPGSGSGQLQELPASLQMWLEQPSAAEAPAAARGSEQQHLAAQQQGIDAADGRNGEVGREPSRSGVDAEEGVVLQPHPATPGPATTQLRRRTTPRGPSDAAAESAGGTTPQAAQAQHNPAAAATREAHHAPPQQALQLADLDAAVLAELPYHIQLEVKRELGLAPPAGGTAAPGATRGGATAAAGGRGTAGGGRQQRRGRGAGPARGRGQEAGSIRAFFAAPGDS
jgi:hypothetical protein